MFSFTLLTKIQAHTQTIHSIHVNMHLLTEQHVILNWNLINSPLLIIQSMEVFTNQIQLSFHLRTAHMYEFLIWFWSENYRSQLLNSHFPMGIYQEKKAIAIYFVDGLYPLDSLLSLWLCQNCNVKWVCCGCGPRPVQAHKTTGNSQKLSQFVAISHC